MGFNSMYIHAHTVLDQPYLFCSYPGVEGVPDLSEAVHQVRRLGGGSPWSGDLSVGAHTTVMIGTHVSAIM